MELYQLRTFIVVAEEGNVTRAAARLGLTPPSVSAQIKHLEEELHVQLFVRTSQGMCLTEHGTLLRSKAEHTLQAAAAMVSEAMRLQAHLVGQVSFGLNATPEVLRVGAIAVHLQSTSPGITLQLVASGSGKILEALHTEALDIGYVFGPITDTALIARRVDVVELVVAVPTRWAQQVAQAGWEEIATLPWLYADLYCPFQGMIDQLFAQRQLDYHRVVLTGDEATKCALVSAGVGLALLERSEAQAAMQAGKLVIWDTPPLWCDLSVAYARQRAHDPMIQAVAASVGHAWGLE
jgi:DNA-binding transcriptional LysR family regulator